MPLRCLFFSFLKVTIYQHELYRVSHPKQVVNRILRTVLCNQIFGPMSTKTAQISQNCLYNLDGLKWSKDLFSQNIFKIMLANIFGHPAAKTLARWRWICDQKYSEDLMCLIHLLGQHLIDAPPFPFIHSEFESTHIPTFHRTIFQAFFEIRFHLKYLIHHWSVSAAPRLRWSAIPFAHWPSSRHHY